MQLFWSKNSRLKEDKKMTIDEIVTLIQAVSDNGLTSFVYEEGDQKLILTRAALTEIQFQAHTRGRRNLSGHACEALVHVQAKQP